MKIILLDDVKTVGKKGDIVEISDGYAKNFIIPKKLGVEASQKNIEDHKTKQSNLEHKRKLDLDEFRRQKDVLEASEYTATSKLGSNGKLFGAVTNKEIAEIIKTNTGIEIEKKKIVVDTIKSLGKYEAVIKLDKEITAKVVINIVESN